MKKIGFSIILIVLQQLTFAQKTESSAQLNCTDAHEGSFEVHYQDKTITAKRTGNVQYEYIDEGFIKYNIEWRSDCVYELVLQETDLERMKPYIGAHYVTTLSEREKGGFNYSCIIIKDGMTIKGYMKKLKP